VTSVVAETEVEVQEQPPRAPRRRPQGKKAPRKAIPKKVENIVWARAAGRCQYAGCNKLLVGDQISGAANANTAYIGHIVADSPEGPRGDPVRSPKLAHDPDTSCSSATCITACSTARWSMSIRRTCW
jgi:hypothetical protein